MDNMPTLNVDTAETLFERRIVVLSIIATALLFFEFPVLGRFGPVEGHGDLEDMLKRSESIEACVQGASFDTSRSHGHPS
jgi:hypothetical protein